MLHLSFSLRSLTAFCAKLTPQSWKWNCCILHTNKMASCKITLQCCWETSQARQSERCKPQDNTTKVLLWMGAIWDHHNKLASVLLHMQRQSCAITTLTKMIPFPTPVCRATRRTLTAQLSCSPNNTIHDFGTSFPNLSYIGLLQ